MRSVPPSVTRVRLLSQAVRERLREVDANLLLSLHALLEEKNLTHAGERMTMSQPAMSGALARLRKHFDDELLIRVGRGFELSPLAEQLKPSVADAVEAAEALLGNQRDFDPSSSTRRFSVSMSEYAMTVLSEPLIRHLGEQAPAARWRSTRSTSALASSRPSCCGETSSSGPWASSSRAAPSRCSPTTWSASSTSRTPG